MNRRNFCGTLLGAAAIPGSLHAQTTAHPPRLTIREVRAVRLKDGFNSRFVRVYTDQGLTGTGETMDTAGAEYIINNNIGPSLIGRNPLDIEGIWFDLWSWRHTTGTNSPVFLRGLGGPYLAAMSGVEMALWDLAGKALGVPVYRLLGGKLRTRIPVYLHARTIGEARRLAAETHVKALKIGMDYTPDAATLAKGWDPAKAWGIHLNNPQLDAIVHLVASMRETVGKEFGLMLECHTRYDTESAIQLCRLVEPYRLDWVEEPVPSDNVDAMARVRQSSPVPIAAGENIYTRYGFRPFLEKEALSILQPDMSKTGGLLETRKIASMAETYFVPLAPHGVASPLATMAYAQVCATIPNLMILEWTHYENPLYTSLTTPVKLDNGFLPVSESPGIGVELIDEAVNSRLDPEFRPL
jgi:galactonate dehydratase